jgi:hypothetical protein
MKRELGIWTVIAPFILGMGAFEWKTATNFDSNEVESLALTGGLLRVGAVLLRNKHIRAILRDFLDSFEKNEGEAQP